MKDLNEIQKIIEEPKGWLKISPADIMHLNDYCKQLKIENQQLHTTRVINWVAVEDKLPSHQTDVITYSKEFEVRNGRCMQKSTWFVNGYSKLVAVTHWAELPKPPCT